MTQKVDTVVIGGGMAGLPMALRAARHGPTVLMESDLLGGTCLNRGCIPTKTMIHSAKIAHLARRSAEFGVDRSTPVSERVSLTVIPECLKQTGDRAPLKSTASGNIDHTVTQEPNLSSDLR